METLVGIAIGSLLTAGLAYLVDGMKWRRQQRADVVEALVHLQSLVWPDNAEWPTFRAHVAAVRARLLMAGVRQDLLDQLQKAALDMRRDMRREWLPEEISGVEGGGEEWVLDTVGYDHLEQAMEQVLQHMANSGRVRRHRPATS